MAKKSALELFEHYYQALISSLPTKDPNFIEDLFKHDLLTEDIKSKLETLSGLQERTSYFLDYVIKPDLVVGSNVYFDKLLNIMKNSNYDNVKELARKVEMDYDINAKCKFMI